MNNNRWILLTALLLVATPAVFEATQLDLLVQDRFYDPSSGWLVHRDAPVPKLIFYTGPKIVLGAAAAVLFALILTSVLRADRLRFPRREAAFLLASVAATLLTIAALKHVTGVFRPAEIARYGGTEPCRTLLESLPHVPGRMRGHDFPAAHCSGGFALMGLYFAFKGRTARRLGL